MNYYLQFPLIGCLVTFKNQIEIAPHLSFQTTVFFLLIENEIK